MSLQNLDFIEDGHLIGTIRLLGVPFHAAFYEMERVGGHLGPATKLSPDLKNEVLRLLELVMPDPAEVPRTVRLPGASRSSRSATPCS